jgi:hypothetical protein
LAGDLAVAEKSPVNVILVERKKNLTRVSRCQWLNGSLLSFI